MGQMVRKSGHYPLLGSGGRINLYSLFVERAMSLVKPNGCRGPAHPIGHLRRQDGREVLQVRVDKRAFGQPIRLREPPPKKVFFKDVHASFKFCAITFGGEERTFDDSKVRVLPTRHRNRCNDPDRASRLRRTISSRSIRIPAPHRYSVRLQGCRYNASNLRATPGTG